MSNIINVLKFWDTYSLNGCEGSKGWSNK